MNDATTQLDLGPLQQATIAAADAKVQEYGLMIAAMASGDTVAQTAHYQAYKQARQADIAAEALLEAGVLDTPNNRTQLSALQAANKALADATKAIAADAKALTAFSKAVDGVVKILGLIAKA